MPRVMEGSSEKNQVGERCGCRCVHAASWRSRAEMAIAASSLDSGKIRTRAGRLADLVQESESVFAHGWLVDVDGDPIEEGIDRRSEPRDRAHRGGEIL